MPRLGRHGLPPLLGLVRSGVSTAEGLRAGFAVATIVALAQLVHWPGLMNAALAALLTCLCDAGGPVRARLPPLLWFGALGAAITIVFGLLRREPLGIAIPVAAVGVFCTSYARSLGQSAMQVGNLLTVVLVLAMRAPVPDLSHAAALGGLFLAGNLWAALLTMVIWRLHPYEASRRANAEVFRRLAVMASDLRQLATLPAAEEALWDRHARLHRRAVREAIEQAREIAVSTLRVRGTGSGRAKQTAIRLAAADQTFDALIALSGLLTDGIDAAWRGPVERMLRLLSPILMMLSRVIVADTGARYPGLERAAAAVAVVARGSGGPASPVARIGAALSDKLRVAITLSGSEELLPSANVDSRRRWWRLLWLSLARDDTVRRHAARASLVSALAFAVTLPTHARYAHWLTITLVLTIQPYFALTVTRAVERIGGTVLGGLLAALLGVACTTPLAMAAALFPLSILALSLRGASFGLFMLFITPIVVLLSELGQTGGSEWHIAAMRALATVAGGVLALVASMVLWPSWEPARLGRDTRAAIAANVDYAAAELGLMLDEMSEAEVEAARRAAGLASGAMEASLQRALLEPRRGSGGLDGMLTVDAALRRMAARVSALHAMQASAARHPDIWRAWRRWVCAAAASIAEGRDLPEPRPDLPADEAGREAVSRIASQLGLIHDVLKSEPPLL